MVTEVEAAAAILSFKSLNDAGRGILAVREFHKWLVEQTQLDQQLNQILQKFIDVVPQQMLNKG